MGRESDWATIAFASNNIDVSSVKNGSVSLRDYLWSDLPDSSTPPTSLERKILSVVAMGNNPGDFNGVNLVEKLHSLHSDNQLGDPTLLNDDIFGVLALVASGPLANSEILANSLEFILAHQAESGGFSWSTDTCEWCQPDGNDTSAVIQAFSLVKKYDLANLELKIRLDVSLALAKNFLLTTQNPDGGFGYDAGSDSDGSSTAWALMALDALGAGESEQAEKAKTWLVNNQNGDGGFHYQAGFGSDTSTSSHAVIALSNSSWVPKVFDPEIEPTPTPNPTSAPTSTPVPTPTPTPAPTTSSSSSNNSATQSNSSNDQSGDSENNNSDSSGQTATDSAKPSNLELGSRSFYRTGSDQEGDVLGEQDSDNHDEEGVETTAELPKDSPELYSSPTDDQPKINFKNISLTAATLSGMVLLAISLRVWEKRKER